MNRLDIALDLETLGTNNSPVITQIGAVAFDITTGKVIRQFMLNISIDSCLKAGLKVDGSTIKWWLTQKNEVKDEVFNSEKEVTISKALNAFRDWITALNADTKKSNIYLWGNGILADNTWIKGANEALNIPEYLPYTNHRDVRTLLELATMKNNITKSIITKQIQSDGNHHNALSDAKWAAKLITACWNLIV
jgi:hypothetical protein